MPINKTRSLHEMQNFIVRVSYLVCVSPKTLAKCEKCIAGLIGAPSWLPHISLRRYAITVQFLQCVQTLKTKSPYGFVSFFYRVPQYLLFGQPMYNHSNLFIYFYFIHFSRLNSVSLKLFWENTGRTCENYQVF